MDALLRDREAQKKGFVVVVWNNTRDSPSRAYMGIATRASRFFNSMPFKFSSYHYCCCDYSMRSPALGFMSSFIGKYARLRVRTYNGTVPVSCGIWAVSLLDASRSSLT